MEGIAGSSLEQALARAPARRTVKPFVDDKSCQVLNPLRPMMDETLNEFHVDGDLVGAVPVDFRNIDIRQQIQKARRFPIPAQRFAEFDGLPCFHGQSLRRQPKDVSGRAKEGMNGIKPGVIG